MSQLQKITPFLWFNNQAKEAADYYCSLFKNSKITSNSDLIVEFELDGMSFTGINGGPKYKFTEAISFLVLCEDQKEIDHFWDKLTADGGEEGQCSWCKDKYGLSWQIVPRQFIEMMKSGKSEKTQRVFNAMLGMKKLIILDLENAFNA